MFSFQASSIVKSETTDTEQVDNLDTNFELLQQVFEFAAEDIDRNAAATTTTTPFQRSSNKTQYIECDESSSSLDLRGNANSVDYDSNPMTNNDNNKPSTHVFIYPTALPEFSTGIKEAFKNETIQTRWSQLIGELAEYVMTINPTIRDPNEYRAIGRSVYEKYPLVGREGPKPWACIIIIFN
ncbi:unnamed protein product [Didymodactylos carnosus]|uniref:Uncharacterized protein n=1 Tax=Didymodactylos carnosus TaxID=1234261 RepID=A0A814BFF3_9BILA|nr:unnamed protein product [Didymodactylos carnosus]CAF1236217.1 unnamed protein product [Didymodactylos carnosus]CAF3704712.1 unnamed protein product [Didymodactylos carnosus]CAF4043831.1 unnamed protein product [Didymodactylos carnosus]